MDSEEQELKRQQREWLRALMREHGLTGNKIAKMSRVSPSTINRFLNDSTVTHALSATTVRKIANGLEVPPPPFQLTGAPSKGMAQLERVNVPERGPPTLPVRGTSHAAGPDGYIQLNGDPIEWVARPRGLEGVKEAYGTYVIGESMSPKYEHGQLVYVHPGKPYRKGHFVVVELSDGRGLVKQFLRQDNRQIVLRQFKPPQDLKLSLAEVKSVHQIVSSDELG